MYGKFRRILVVLAIICVSLFTIETNSLSDVNSHVKLTQPNGNTFGRFGSAVAYLGDIDGNGTGDLAIGA